MNADWIEVARASRPWSRGTPRTRPIVTNLARSGQIKVAGKEMPEDVAFFVKQFGLARQGDGTQK